MSQLEFGQERYLRACIDPAKRIRATRHGGQWSETILEGALEVSSTPVPFLKGGYPIIFASNVFHNSHLIQKRIQNQPADRMNSL